MIKKDYQIIADALRQAYSQIYHLENAKSFFNQVVANIELKLAQDNERFNVVKFEKAIYGHS